MTLTQQNKRARILVVDDQLAVLDAVRQWLAFDPNLVIVGQTASATEAISIAQELKPDVVLLDVKLANADGITVAAQLREAVPQSKIVILTLYDDPATRERARAAGTVAFVTKHDPVETLLAAIHQAAGTASVEDNS